MDEFGSVEEARRDLAQLLGRKKGIASGKGSKMMKLSQPRLRRVLLSLCAYCILFDLLILLNYLYSKFLDPMTLLTCTLLGTFSQHTISRVNDKLVLETAWTVYVKGVAKVNALVAFDDWIAVGGFGKDGEGLVEMWKIECGGADEGNAIIGSL